MGLLVGGFAFALGRFLPRSVIWGLGVAFALAVLASPLLPSAVPPPAEIKERVSALPYSGYHRLIIWEFTAKRIGERPVLGWGFNSSPSIPGRDTRPDNKNYALPLHPHNAALQWWLELGAVGALVGAGLIGWLFAAIGRAHADAVEKAMYLGLVSTAITICSLGFGIWQSWWLAGLWLSGVFMAAARQPPPPSTSAQSS
jgi:O-antigen ligase